MPRKSKPRKQPRQTPRKIARARTYERKTEKITPIQPAPAKKPSAITPIEYCGLQDAYEFLNKELFGGRLPDVMITYERKAHSMGSFSADQFSGRIAAIGKKHRVTLNPDHFIDRTDKQIVSTLGHE